MSFPHQAVLQFSADTHWFPRFQPHSYTTWSWGRPQLRGWGPETASTLYAHHKSRPPTLLNHRLFPQAPPWGRQCARTNSSRTQRHTSARLLAYPWDTTRERPRGRGAQGKGVGRAVRLRTLGGTPFPAPDVLPGLETVSSGLSGASPSSTWRAPGSGNCQLRPLGGTPFLAPDVLPGLGTVGTPHWGFSGASSTWVQVMKSLLTGSLPPSLSPGERSPWVGLSFQPSNHRQRASPLYMNNKRHLSHQNHSGNFKSQRSSVPGTSYKDHSHVFLILSQYM